MGDLIQTLLIINRLNQLGMIDNTQWETISEGLWEELHKLLSGSAGQMIMNCIEGNLINMDDHGQITINLLNNNKHNTKAV